MENGKEKNVIQEALEEVAKKRGVPLEQVEKEALKELEKLRKSGIPGGKQSADEHEKLIKGTKKK